MKYRIMLATSAFPGLRSGSIVDGDPDDEATQERVRAGVLRPVKKPDPETTWGLAPSLPTEFAPPASESESTPPDSGSEGADSEPGSESEVTETADPAETPADAPAGDPAPKPRSGRRGGRQEPLEGTEA